MWEFDEGHHNRTKAYFFSFKNHVFIKNQTLINYLQELHGY